MDPYESPYSRPYNPLPLKSQGDKTSTGVADSSVQYGLRWIVVCNSEGNIDDPS